MIKSQIESVQNEKANFEKKTKNVEEEIEHFKEDNLKLKIDKICEKARIVERTAFSSQISALEQQIKQKQESNKRHEKMIKSLKTDLNL